MKSLGVVIVLSLLHGTIVAQNQTVIDRIIAVVDKEIITESELRERLALVAMQNRLDPTSPELRNQVLEGMITEKLVLAQAILDSVVVTDEEVRNALDQQLQNIVRQAGSEARVEQYYGMPLSRIRREYRDDIRKQLLVQRVRQTREAGMLVSRRETEEFFATFQDSLPRVPDQYELSNIFVSPKPDSQVEQQSLLRLRAVRDSIRAGGDFADFARRHSEDGTAASGGDLGWAKRGTFVPEFESAVFSLLEGGLSDIVKTEFGLHLIQLVERRGESVHARHILLRLNRGATSDSVAVQFLRSLRQQAINGADFAELARKYSEDDETRPVGGDMGTVTLEQLEREFAEVVQKLDGGQISEPHRITLKNTYGFQIVLVRKKIPAHDMNLTDDYRRIEQVALFVKKNRKNAEWVEELKKTIYWETRL